MTNRRLYNIYQAFYFQRKDYPVYCDDKDAWLGKGYYFWDVRIEDAKWWGNEHLYGQYSICQSTYDFDSQDLFDLLGNNTHVDLFVKYSKDYINRNKKAGNSEAIYVYQIISFMKKNCSGFNYKAIRACPYPVTNQRNLLQYFFEKKKKYVFISRKTQLCVFNMDFLQSKCKIIYTNSINPNSCI